MHNVLDLRNILRDELSQRRESGFDVVDLEDAVREAVADGSPARMEQLLADLEDRPLRQDWPHQEPTDRGEILAALPPAPDLPALELSDAELRERLSGAWLGRCAGCNLGKPVEGWSREKIRRYLDAVDAHPILDYLPQLDPFPEGLQLNWCWPETTRGNIRSMARDDDTDYTILGLHILEDRGFGFGPEDVGAEWQDHLPFTQTYTAERAAYRNLIHGHRPPETATFRNPYREWIGAQIRGDMWGYVSPGDPWAASRLAYQDASLSHTQNGIYGEMWASALIATCFVVGDLRSAIEASLAFVPERSRLAEAIRAVLDLHAQGRTWEETRDDIEVRHGHYSFVHTINNSAVVTAALLWGEGDFSRTIGLAVEAGWDTDCTGATTGSIFGAAFGAAALPSHWVDPLNDRISSAIANVDTSSISDLVERTMVLARRHGDEKEQTDASAARPA
ncbi:MAG: ADP-ribosylglycohydrolase family protein [Actinomycetota bacterium]